ncbi:class I SAM-dependent methyltransferase [Peribacillus cavernae]|uniref:Class I SAM-dependent methyltransferase n=1 Tax=Peribacillus cavernae TaxID=1674310 RepID=A0A433HHN0_9BACI|nr:class I SAM-dependent methyltransferase [Peribacillus cavernae]MDQ0221000.1 ubiquinone/menaquinone biosynthesis C-methylase UbiE [Peribacillus cavernae]RUQ27906.1 class I SAM-dependent methyltransferase [Peribacillus cavernae]
MSFSYQDALAYSRIGGAHPGGMMLTKKILQNEKINRHTKILDAGCGTGQTSAYLAKTFSCRVYAIDSHPEMIKTANQRFTEENLSIKVVKGDLESLPFPNDSFDLIIAESSTAFTEVSKSLKEYFRVLKPSGALVNIDMTAEQKLIMNEKAEIMEFYKMNEILTEEEWIKAIKKAGFKTVDIVKSKSILQELEEYTFEEDELSEHLPTFANVDPEIEEVIDTHQKLLVAFREQLGYRVFKAKKTDLLTYL